MSIKETEHLYIEHSRRETDNSEVVFVTVTGGRNGLWCGIGNERGTSGGHYFSLDEARTLARNILWAADQIEKSGLPV